MLIYANGNCDVCGKSLGMEVQQQVQVTCHRCGKNLTTCSSCKSKGCPDCGGKLTSLLEKATKEGIIF